MTTSAALRTVVVIPTFNESGNIFGAIEAVRSVVSDIHILVVDDSSPDGTGSVVRAHPRYGDDVMLLTRFHRTGLADAYREAMNWALLRQYDRIVQMDADGSHRAADLPVLLASCLTDDSLVIGSRWVFAGRVENWSRLRQWISRVGNSFARAVLDCDVRDLTSGFRVWGHEALRAALKHEGGTMAGYGFQVEMAYVHWKRGGDVVSVPICFIGREIGNSKMTLRIAAEAGFGAIRLRRRFHSAESSRGSR